MRARFMVAATLAAAFAVPALGAEAPQGDPVVAKVNGLEIHRSELQAAYEALPEQYRQMPLDSIYQPLLDRVITSHLLTAEATKEKLDQQPAVQAALQRAHDDTLRDQLLQTRVEAATSEQALRAAYDAKKNDPAFAVEEVKARHILLEKEEDAKAVIVALNQGADFATLAKEKSTEPGAKDSGGDLGYFKKEAMVPEFAEAAFAMPKGTYSKTPVQTQFGWHVILVEDHRKTVPTFEQAEPELKQQIAQQTMAGLIQQVKQGADIQRFDANGAPLAAQPVMPQPVEPQQQ